MEVFQPEPLGGGWPGVITTADLVSMLCSLVSCLVAVDFALPRSLPQ